MRHGRALIVFGLLVALWACAVPVGVVSGQTYAWWLDLPEGRVHGQTRHEVLGWGMPSGPFRAGRHAWEATRPVTPELMAAVRRQYPDAVGREGFHVDEGALLLSGFLGGLFFAITVLWWMGVRAWRRRPEWTPARAVAGILMLAAWPWLLGTSQGWVLWERLGHPVPANRLLPPELMISGTVLVASVCLVALLTRSAWSRDAE